LPIPGSRPTGDAAGATCGDQAAFVGPPRPRIGIRPRADGGGSRHGREALIPPPLRVARSRPLASRRASGYALL